MNIIATVSVVFTAFCVWLTVRIVNRRERWAKWTLVGVVGVPVLYALSSGPAIWLAHRMGAADWVFSALETAYGPSLYLAMYSGPIGQPYLWYFGWWQNLILSG